MQMKRIVSNLYRLGVLTVMLLSAGSCGTTDDVVGIFTGKTWKLTAITAEDSNQQYPFWEGGVSGPAFEKSMDLLAKAGNFTVIFSGAALEEGITSGTLNAHGAATSLSGKWEVIDADRTLKIMGVTTSGPTESDILARAFITGLLNVKRYEGDFNNLYIHYQEENKPAMCLWFHPDKSSSSR
jgi:hypothetical protein